MQSTAADTAKHVAESAADAGAGILDTIIDKGVDIGLMIVGAIVVWILGSWAIKIIVKVAKHAMSHREFDETLASYLATSLSVVLKILLVVTVLSLFGVQTTSFAALFAAAGVTIGMAWSGLLANFAAGVFLVFLRPMKVGDFVSAGGVVGTVKEIGLFVTVIDTMDNVQTIIGNNTIFSGTIQNFTENPYRRVELVAQLAHGVDYKQAIELLKKRLVAIPNVTPDQPPQVEIVEFNLAGPVLCVRPFCHNDHYWDVYFATNAAIKEAFGEAGFAVPEKHFHINQGKAA